METDKITLRRFCFSEAKEYNTDHYRWIPEDLLQNGDIITRKGKVFSFQLAGFLVHKNDIYVLFPKNHKIPNEYNVLMDHIQTLASVLLRYQSDGSVEETENDLLDARNGRLPEGIAAALWLIRDFVEYGFIQRQVLCKIHSGNNIDWPRTIKTSDSIISSSGLIYNNPVYRKSSIDMNNMMYFLHRYAVQKSFQRFGWILGYQSFDIDPLMNELPYNVELVLYLLIKELEVTFNDREIKLFKTLIEFIQGADHEDHESSLDTLATKYFHNVWEAMCGFVFKNQYHSIKHHIPNPIWHLHHGGTASTHQRPDILLFEQQSLYVLDAKYYHIPKSLPGWYDLVKQFFYAYSLQHIFPTMFNALIFPDTVPDKIVFFGVVEMENRTDLGKVESFAVDTYTMMKDYANYRYGDWSTRIIDEITKRQPMSIVSGNQRGLD